MVRAVPRRHADRRDVRARLVRVLHLGRGDRSHLVRVRGPRGAAGDVARHGQRPLGADAAAPLVRGDDRETTRTATDDSRLATGRRPRLATRPTSSSRPSSSRPTAASARGRRRSAPRPSPRWPRPRPTSWAPPTAATRVQVRRPPGARGHRRAVPAARRLRGAARQRRHHRVLGRGRVRADRAAQPAPRLRRVLLEVRRRSRRTRRTSRTPRSIESPPGTHPLAARRTPTSTPTASRRTRRRPA